MFLLFVSFYYMFSLSVSDQTQQFLNGIYPIDSINCPNDRKCTFIELCPVILSLMNRNLLPIHRFRQAICGYENSKAKVCCNMNSNTVNPLFTREDGASFVNSNPVPVCGKSFVQGDAGFGGVYPFVARVGFKSDTGEIKYPCSGTILNERTILTTASCALAKSTNYKLDSVLVGEFNAETDPDCNAQKLNISFVIKHPKYHAETFANNIAMLRLKEPIRYTVTAQPICVLSRDEHIQREVNPVVVGWGKLSSQNIKPCQQQSLEMTILSSERCSSYYAQGFSVELCAIGNEMPCSGYNGSPLLFKHEDTHFLAFYLMAPTAAWPPTSHQSLSMYRNILGGF